MTRGRITAVLVAFFWFALGVVAGVKPNDVVGNAVAWGHLPDSLVGWAAVHQAAVSDTSFVVAAIALAVAVWALLRLTAARVPQSTGVRRPDPEPAASPQPIVIQFEPRPAVSPPVLLPDPPASVGAPAAPVSIVTPPSAFVGRADEAEAVVQALLAPASPRPRSPC